MGVVWLPAALQLQRGPGPGSVQAVRAVNRQITANASRQEQTLPDKDERFLALHRAEQWEEVEEALR